MLDKQFAEIDAALASNDVKRAVVAISKQLRSHKSSAERAALLLRRARARLMDARPDDALEDAETSLALLGANADPAAVLEIMVLRGDIYFARYELANVGFADRSDSETALSHYQEVIQTEPDYPARAWVYYQMGRIMLSQNEIEAAISYFNQVLDAPAEPAKIHALAYERLGFIALFEQRQPPVALNYFEQARDRFSDDKDPNWLVQLYIRMSRAHLELHEHDAALNAARKALRTIQGGTSNQQRAALPEAHLAMGEVLAEMPGYEAEAIEHYMRFLQSSKRPPGIDVTWSQVHEAIGRLSFRLEQYQQAINAFNKALELNPYHPWEISLRYQIARCYYRLRVYEKTVESINLMLRAADLDDAPITDWRVYNLLGHALFALEQYGFAIEAYQKALTFAPSAAETLEKTRIYLRFSEELSQSQLYD